MARHSRALVFAVSAALALTACGGDDPTVNDRIPVEGGGGIGDGAQPPPVIGAPPFEGPIPVEGDRDPGDGSGPGVDNGPGSPREIQGGTINPRPRQWEEVAFDQQQDTATLQLFAGVEPCDVVDRVEVDYADDAVTFTLFMGPAQEDMACIAIAEWIAVTVDMDEPLGPRSVVDGAKA